MTVSKVMTKNPVFVRPDMSVNDVKALMTKEKIGKLPVLDKNDKLVGIITKKDLINAGPSAATTLDMYEISYLLSKLKVEKIMTKNVVTVSDNEVVEEAARIMADEGIGCLPVMKGSVLVGIITESDLFHTFVDMFGARRPGVRACFVLPEKPGVLAKVAQSIADSGGNIVAMITCEGDDISSKRCTCKVEGITKEELFRIVGQSALTIEDIR